MSFLMESFMSSKPLQNWLLQNKSRISIFITAGQMASVCAGVASVCSQWIWKVPPGRVVDWLGPGLMKCWGGLVHLHHCAMTALVSLCVVAHSKWSLQVISVCVCACVCVFWCRYIGHYWYRVKQLSVESIRRHLTCRVTMIRWQHRLWGGVCSVPKHKWEGDEEKEEKKSEKRFWAFAKASDFLFHFVFVFHFSVEKILSWENDAKWSNAS